MSNRTPIVVAVAAVAAVGAGALGFAGGWIVKSPEKELVEVVRPPTPEELAEVAAQEKANQDELTIAQIKVAELERRPRRNAPSSSSRPASRRAPRSERPCAKSSPP